MATYKYYDGSSWVNLATENWVTSNYTTLNTAQTISGIKTFPTGTLVNVSNNNALIPNANWMWASPIPKYLWHDLLAFREAVAEYSTNGSTWTKDTSDSFKNNLTNQKENQNITVISDSRPYARFTWDNSSAVWHACQADWLVIGFTYVNPAATCTYNFQTTTDGSDWTNVLTVSGAYNQTPVWFKLNPAWSSCKGVRLLITRTSSKGSVGLSSVRWLTKRWGNQGFGSELESPFQWDNNTTIYPRKSGADLGISSAPWSNIYGTTIYENGTSLSAKYLGKSAQATDSAKLGGTAASSYALKTYVDTSIANLVNSAPETLNTLGELATALQDHEDAYDALLTTVGNKLDSSTAASTYLPKSDVVNNLTSSSTTSALSAYQGKVLNEKFSSYLPKTTYEYNKEIAFGSTGKLYIGAFPMYDSNITVEISATTGTTYNATLVIATQNINTTGGGTLTATVYGDATNTIAPNIYIGYASGSNQIHVYFSPQSWSKNLIHIQAVALAGAPSNVCTNVSSIPSTANRKPTNALTANFQAKGNYLTSVPAASTSALGGIKVSSLNTTAVTVNAESTTANRYYPIELNNDSKAIVNVPWTDTNTWRPVVNNLTSTATDSSLSAAQGKTLNEKISAIIDGSQIVQNAVDADSALYATEAGSVAWANVTGKTNATTSTAGLMSAADKSNLDTIVNSFNSDDADTTIETVKEVLKVFESYPAGTSLVNALASKLDKSGGSLNDSATLKFTMYGSRAVTISGNSIDADMSADTGTWAGNFATVKHSKGTTAMLGWYGSKNDGLYHIFMGGSYSDPAMKMDASGNFTFKNTITGTITNATQLGGVAASSYATTSALSNYMPLSGGTLTGAIKTIENAMGLKLRTHDNYETGWVYGTSGNEAITLAMQNPVTAFQIVYGTKPSAFGSSTWQSVTPLFQTKDGKVIINRKITATSETTNLKLFDVNGDANATTLYENGTALSAKYQPIGSYATLTGSQALTNKTYNGYTLGAACAKGVTDSTSASAISTGTNLVTERDVYYGLASINGARQTSSVGVYAPTSAGSSGSILMSNGSGAPKWTAANSLIVGTAEYANRDSNGNEFNSTYAKKANGIYYIVGTGTTAGTWLGSCDDITEYYDGLTIAYKLNIAGASTTTLNINGLGAKTMYLRGTTKLTTQYAVDTVIIAVYTTVGGAGRWYVNDYDANSYAYVRQYTTTTNANYPLLLAYETTAPSSYNTKYTRLSSTITANPSTGTVTVKDSSNTLHTAIFPGGVECSDVDGNLAFYLYNGSIESTGDIVLEGEASSLTLSPLGIEFSDVYGTTVSLGSQGDLDLAGDITMYTTSGIHCEDGGILGFNDECVPTIVDTERRLAVASDSLDGDYYYYTFPEKEGTVALTSDIAMSTPTLILTNSSYSTNGFISWTPTINKFYIIEIISEYGDSFKSSPIWITSSIDDAYTSFIGTMLCADSGGYVHTALIEYKDEEIRFFWENTSITKPLDIGTCKIYQL